VLAFGTYTTPVVRRVSRFGDPSYGLYIWAFPVQQSVVAVFGPLPLAVNLLLVVPITAALAYASWHLIERRALALKGRRRSAAEPAGETSKSDEVGTGASA
jgi:peptidoglycan/LPS O-acetylase OafA/YrhL